MVNGGAASLPAEADRSPALHVKGFRRIAKRAGRGLATYALRSTGAIPGGGVANFDLVLQPCNHPVEEFLVFQQ